MSQWYRLTRHDVELSDELSPGEYRAPLDRSGIPRVVWKCPRCYRLLSILRVNHDIRFDGSIYPSVRCPHGCGFEEWLHLEGWIPKAVGAA